MRCSRDVTGFTLIELLAVIVILTAVTAIGSMSLVGTSEAAQLRGCASSIREMDSMARLVAQSLPYGAIQLRQNSSTHMLTLTSTAGDEEIAQTAVPEAVRVRFTAGQSEQPVAIVTFDRVGCTDSYRITCEGPTRSLTYLVNGVSGEFQEVVP